MEELTSDPTNYSEIEQNWLSQMWIDTAGCVQTELQSKIQFFTQKHSFPSEMGLYRPQYE